VELRGPTLTLRYPESQDAERIFELARDDEVAKWFSWGPYSALEQAQQWIAGVAADRDAGRDLAFVIERGDDGVVGVTSLNELSARDRRCMVGTWIGREWWGTGVNAESKAMMAHLAFEICGLRRLGAYSNTGNARSTTALERLGFKREGTLSRWHRHGDEEFDVHVFALLPEDWASPFVAETYGDPPAAWLSAS
jgi:ribosomal-protein-alanine N-acetyltransferase